MWSRGRDELCEGTVIDKDFEGALSEALQFAREDVATGVQSVVIHCVCLY